MPGGPRSLDPPLTPPPREVIQATETRALRGQGFAGTLANLVVTAVTAGMLWAEVGSSWRLAPLLGVAAPFVVRLTSRRRALTELADLLAWRRRYLVAVLISGTAWGVTVALTMPAVGFTYQVFIAVIAIGLSAGALATLGEVLAVFLAFTVPVLLATTLAIAASFVHHGEALGALIGLYAVVLIKTSLVHNRSLTDVLALSIRNAALVEELEQATRDAQAASVAKGEFLTRMSHELRTPMNGILGATELLRSAPLPSRERHLADVAHSSSELLLTLLNDVLDMARIEAGRIELEDEPLSVEALLDDVATLLCVSADLRGLTLVCHTAPNVPRRVLGDATRLRQILTNLAGNALKFTERGEVEIRARIEPGDGGDDLVMSVRDTGVGIPPEQHTLIFGAFEQGRDAHAHIRGTGLGLAISARLATLMGGTISIESEVGRGSTFTLRVPSRPVATPPEPTLPASLTGRRALVFAPQDLEREALATWLTEAGAEVVACVSEAALSEARAGVDVVILDREALVGEGALQASIGDTPAVVIERPSAHLDTVCGLDATCRAYPRPLQRGRLVAAVREALGISGTPSTRRERPPLGALARVLVVDDDEVNRLVARRLLERLGATVEEAASGPAGLELLSVEGFDLVLMDCEMPGMDGREATREARARKVRCRNQRRLPIVAVTAHVMPDHHAECLAAGMDEVLTKPITRAALLAILDRYVPAPGVT